MERKLNGRKREPSRLALQLAEAFAPCEHWSQVRVQREAAGRTGTSTSATTTPKKR